MWIAFPNEIVRVKIVEDPTSFFIKYGNYNDYVTVMDETGEKYPIKKTNLYFDEMSAAIESDRMKRLSED